MSRLIELETPGVNNEPWKGTGGAGHVVPGTPGGAAAVTTLLNAVDSTGAGSAVAMPGGRCTFHGKVVGTGAVTATIKVQVSNDNSTWIDLGTIALSGTTSAADGFASNAPWAYVRGNVTAISGTNAAASLYRGV